MTGVQTCALPILDMQDQLKNTALILAVQKGKKDTVALLLDKGADVTAKNTAGKNAWDVAQELPETSEQSRAVKEEIKKLVMQASRARTFEKRRSPSPEKPSSSPRSSGSGQGTR